MNAYNYCHFYQKDQKPMCSKLKLYKIIIQINSICSIFKTNILIYQQYIHHFESTSKLNQNYNLNIFSN